MSSLYVSRLYEDSMHAVKIWCLLLSTVDNITHGLLTSLVISLFRYTEFASDSTIHTPPNSKVWKLENFLKLARSYCQSSGIAAKST